jgi:IMP dehydrogenase
MEIREALTFDDVLLEPGASEVLPADVNTATRLTRGLSLNIPLISAAMDTVTEARLAIAMAQAGGLGVIHRNMTPAEQAEQVKMVKKFESGMVIDPITIFPDQTVGEIILVKEVRKISGFPVVDRDSGKLVGILTNRDMRFADMNERVADLMTKSNLITVRDGVNENEAKKLLYKHRIERVIVVDDANKVTGLITVKDFEKAQAFPNRAKDDQGRLLVGAASTIGDAGYERSLALIEAGADVVVIDTAHGHSKSVLQSVERIKRASNKTQIVAGNVATADGAKALIDAGADAVKVGIGPGSICTTRVVAGVGVPQLTAVVDAAKAAQKADVPVIADGGTPVSG